MIITVLNHKGGVAKTTTTQALGLALQKMGYKVLLIDLDGQASLSKACDYDDEVANIADVLDHDVNPLDTIQRTIIDIIPADDRLYTLYTNTNKIGKITFKIKPIEQNYDFIIIDTAPASNALTMSALLASDGAIVPVEPDIMSIEGVHLLEETLQTAQLMNNNLKILGILVSQFSSRQNLDTQAVEVLHETSERLGTKLFDTKIRKSVAIREAQGQRLNMFDYAPQNNAVKDYMKFAKEVEAMTHE